MDTIPGCIDTYANFATAVNPPLKEHQRIIRHLHAIQIAYNEGVEGCIIWEDGVYLVASTHQWRFSIDMVMHHTYKWNLSKQPTYIVQLYSDNIPRLHDQAAAFRHTNQWFRPRTAQDTGGLSCYYIHKSAMQYLIQTYSTFDGWDTNLFPKTPDLVLFQIPTIVVQIPLFYSKYDLAPKQKYAIQESMPMLFQNIPYSAMLYAPVAPFQTTLYLSGFPESAFQDSANFPLHFLSGLFRFTPLWPYKVTRNWEEANVLLTSEPATEINTIVPPPLHKKWRCSIQFSPGNQFKPTSKYNVTVADVPYESPGIISIPSFFFHIYQRNYFVDMLRNTHPFIGSNDAHLFQNAYFLNMDHPPINIFAQQLIDVLFDAGYIHSYGLYKNNCPALSVPPGSKEYIDVLIQYKFIFCLDDTNRTDVVDALANRCIPIFDHSYVLHNVLTRLFNPMAYFVLSNNPVNNKNEAVDRLNETVNQLNHLLSDFSGYCEKGNAMRIKDAALFTAFDMEHLQSRANQVLTHHFQTHV